MDRADSGEPDPQTIERARRGDTAAFASLVERYQGPVYNLVYRMLGSPTEAEDGAQETFLRAFARIRTYRPENRFTPWILSIAAHYCIDRLRRKKFRWLSLDEENIQDTLPMPDPGPEETALQHERSQEVQQLLGKLPPHYRAVVALKYWNDLPVEEIAHITGDSVSSVKVKLFRARQMMARELDERPRGMRRLHLELEGVSGDAR